MTPGAGAAGSVAALDGALLGSSRGMRMSLGLSPSEWLVQMIVVATAVGRYLRVPDGDPAFLGPMPLPPAQAGRTSRRRVADVSGLPLETVRRIVARLEARALIGEDAGGLHGGGGMLKRFLDAGLAEPALRSVAAAAGGDPAVAAARFAASPRPVAYRLGNTCLELTLSLGRQYRLPPATLELFLRLLLGPPMPASGRETARLLDLPRETLRRHADRLAALGLVRADASGLRVPLDVRTAHAAHPEAAERRRLGCVMLRALGATPGQPVAAAGACARHPAMAAG